MWRICFRCEEWADLLSYCRSFAFGFWVDWIMNSTVVIYPSVAWYIIPVFLVACGLFVLVTGDA